MNRNRIHALSDERLRAALHLRAQPWFVRYIFAVGIATLIVLGLVIDRAELDVEQASSWRARTLRVTNALHDLRFQLSDLESLQRGFIITGDPRFVDRYREGVESVDHDLLLLRQLITDGGQRHRLNRLQPLIAAHLAYRDEVFEVRRQEGVEAAGRAIAGGREKKSSDDIRRLIRTLERGQDRLLAYGEEHLWTGLLQTRWALLVGLLWSVPPFVLLRRGLQRKAPQWKEMLFELQQANGRAPVPCHEMEARPMRADRSRRAG
jgi:CHASE3 domain sensor protein